MAEEHRVPMITREKLRRHRFARVELQRQVSEAREAYEAARDEFRRLREQLSATPRIAEFAVSLGVDPVICYGIAQRKKPYCALPDEPQP